ncbi:hypothetical protein Tco_1057695 [Tanacetum coccineum]|uniref:Uncharacterized protein n=1 Tax=Tanacetum coccineum TaxID=301880 RepID=A0ABQ5H6N3_9ASTR
MLQARENLMETIQAFLNEYDHIPPEEKCMALLLADERFLKIKQAVEEQQNQPEVMQELLLKLMNDFQILNGIQPKQAEQEEPIAQKKSSVENLVPIPSEFKGIFEDICDVPSCDNDHFDAEFGLINSLLSRDISITSPKIYFLPEDDDFSPISIFEEKSVTFSNPLFDSNYDFTSSDDDSLSDEDVPEDKVKIYSNPLFEFDDGYISSDVNPLFDEVLEDIKFKDSCDFNLDESTFLVTPLFDSNKDECFTPCDDVEPLLHHDSSISIVSILEGFTNEPSLEENDDLFDLESKENDWKKILYDAPFNNFDELNEDKCFDPGGGEIDFSLNIEDDDSFTFVIQTFLSYLAYPEDSPLLLSTGSEDTIFDPGIST